MASSQCPPGGQLPHDQPRALWQFAGRTRLERRVLVKMALLGVGRPEAG
jgi:hypothetical protein